MFEAESFEVRFTFYFAGVLLRCWRSVLQVWRRFVSLISWDSDLFMAAWV